MNLIEMLRNAFSSSVMGTEHGNTTPSPVLSKEGEDKSKVVKLLQEQRMMSSKSRTVEDDACAVVEGLGVIEPGATYTVSLKQLSVWAPRHRVRKDSYGGLVSYIRKHYGVNIIIVSIRDNKEKED